MKKRIIRYFIHIITTVAALLVIGVVILLSEDGGIHYGDNPAKMNWEKDGPYIFFENDSALTLHYIQGNQDDGFHITSNSYGTDSIFKASCHFNLDNTELLTVLADVDTNNDGTINYEEFAAAITTKESSFSGSLSSTGQPAGNLSLDMLKYARNTRESIIR